MSAESFMVVCADGSDDGIEYPTWDDAEHWRKELDLDICGPHRVQRWVEIAEWQDCPAPPVDVGAPDPKGKT